MLWRFHWLFRGQSHSDIVRSEIVIIEPRGTNHGASTFTAARNNRAARLARWITSKILEAEALANMLSIEDRKDHQINIGGISDGNTRSMQLMD